MPKALKSLRQANPDILNQGRPVKITGYRHLILSGNKDDFITLPLCGNPDRRNKRKTVGVTCPACRRLAVELSNCDSYDKALELITLVAPKIPKPDLAIMEERHGDQPSKRATDHMLAAQFLTDHAATTPEEIPLNIIGSKEATYYWNMVELGLIDEDGEPLEPIWEQEAMPERTIADIATFLQSEDN